MLVGSLRGGNGERPLPALISYHQVSQKTGRKRDVFRRKISSRSPNGLNDLWIGTAIFWEYILGPGEVKIGGMECWRKKTAVSAVQTLSPNTWFLYGKIVDQVWKSLFSGGLRPWPMQKKLKKTRSKLISAAEGTKRRRNWKGKGIGRHLIWTENPFKALFDVNMWGGRHLASLRETNKQVQTEKTERDKKKFFPFQNWNGWCN